VLALSIRQPWAWAILHAGKDVENRSWKLPRNMIGRRVLIHASAGCTLDEYEDGALSIALTCQADMPLLAELPRGAIVGAVTLLDCLDPEQNVGGWHVAGKYGWRLSDARELPKPVPCKGRLGFWPVPDVVAAEIRRIVDGHGSP